MYLGENGYRVIAVCQQKFTRQHYDRMIGRYANEEDLSGFPPNDYCFIGFFSLLDPPRVEATASVLKAQGAQIRVVMITGDDPTTAKAIAKQVHIFTPKISDTNGVHTFERIQEENGRTTFSLYQNEQLLKQHTLDNVTRIVLENNNNSSIMQTHVEDKETLSDQKLSWYKRALVSCRNQFTEPKTDLPHAVKMEYIPYAVVVSSQFFFDSCLTFTKDRLMAQILALWMMLCGTGYYHIKS